MLLIFCVFFFLKAVLLTTAYSSLGEATEIIQAGVCSERTAAGSVVVRK